MLLFREKTYESDFHVQFPGIWYYKLSLITLSNYTARTKLKTFCQEAGFADVINSDSVDIFYNTNERGVQPHVIGQLSQFA